MKRTVWTAAILATLSYQSFAGVVVETVSKDLNSNQESPVNKIYAQDGMLRMEPHQQDQDQKTTVIFQGEALLILNHKDKTYFRMNEESVTRISSQISSAMKQMEEQMAALPPEQRAMMEKMMKGKMPGRMMQGLGSQPPPRRIQLEGSEQVGDYPCQKYVVYRGQEKTQEICAAPVDQVGDIAEVIDTFRSMARFSEKMLESVKRSPVASLADSPFQTLNDIEGFPVLTRSFENGQAVTEVLLKSAIRQSLSDDLFSAPADYREVDPFAQAGRGSRP